MNNIFIEGPIQTGKSTLIREVLVERFGPDFDRVGGFTCQRMFFPAKDKERRMGFRLMPAASPISSRVCVATRDEKLINNEGVFKLIGPGGPILNLNVFNTLGVNYMRQAFKGVESGNVSIVLLDEIGGHEMVCDEFRLTLYELLQSEIPCMGVMKLMESTRRMIANMPSHEATSILQYNMELREKIIGSDSDYSEILYYERGDKNVREKLELFLKSVC